MAPSIPICHDPLSWRIHNTFLETIDSSRCLLAIPRSRSLSSLEKLQAEAAESSSDFDSSPRALKALHDISPRSSTSMLSTAASSSASQSDSEAPDPQLTKTKLNPSSAPCEMTKRVCTACDEPGKSAARGHTKSKQKPKCQALTGKSDEALKHKSTGKSDEALKHKSKQGQRRPLDKPAKVQARGPTTFIVRNIVCRFSEQDVMDVLDKTDLAHKYDFVYLPKGSDRVNNLGYFFLNLKAPDYVDECMSVLHGKTFGDRPTTKICEVSTAQFQGEELLAHLAKKDKRDLAKLALRWCTGCGPEAESKSQVTCA